MATKHGETSFQHDDYKVQREFERVSRSGTSKKVVQGGSSFIGGGTTEGGNNEPINNAIPWALSVRKNKAVPVSVPKKTQSIAFLFERYIQGAYTRVDVDWNIDSRDLEDKYQSDPNNQELREATVEAHIRIPIVLTQCTSIDIKTLPLPDPGGVLPVYEHRYSFVDYIPEEGKYGWYVWTEVEHGLQLANKKAYILDIESEDDNFTFEGYHHAINENTIAIYGIFKDLTYLADIYNNNIPITSSVASNRFLGFQELATGLLAKITIHGLTGRWSIQ